MKDLRFKILEHFEGLENSTAETNANLWLSKQDNDLGTIRRSLIDLIQSGFIRLSSIDERDPVKWLNEHWDTTTHGERSPDDDDKKSSKRLVDNVGRHKKVPEVKLYTTVKGLMFIKEYRRFKNYHFDKIIYTVLGFILAILGFLLKEYIPKLIN